MATSVFGRRRRISERSMQELEVGLNARELTSRRQVLLGEQRIDNDDL